MFTEQELIDELARRGYRTEIKEFKENGVTSRKLGVILDENASVNPALKFENCMNEDVTAEEFVDDALKYLNEHVNEIDYTDLLNNVTKEDILDNVYIFALQQGKDNDFITQNMCDFAIGYRYVLDVADEAISSIKVNQSLLDWKGITLEELNEHAEKNTYKESEFVAEDLNEMIRRMAQERGFMMPPLPPNEFNMIVITNPSKIDGFIQAFNMNSMCKYAEEHDIDTAVIIPSSRNEAIMIPNAGSDNGMDLNKMIHEVNKTMLDEKEVMGQHAYIFDFTCEPTNISVLS